MITSLTGCLTSLAGCLAGCLAITLTPLETEETTYCRVSMSSYRTANAIYTAETTTYNITSSIGDGTDGAICSLNHVTDWAVNITKNTTTVLAGHITTTVHFYYSIDFLRRSFFQNIKSIH